LEGVGRRRRRRRSQQYDGLRCKRGQKLVRDWFEGICGRLSVSSFTHSLARLIANIVREEKEKINARDYAPNTINTIR
jgi:hypothetical protein